MPFPPAPAPTPLCRAPRKALPAGACADAPDAQNSSTAIATQQHPTARLLCAIFDGWMRDGRFLRDSNGDDQVAQQQQRMTGTQPIVP